MVATASRTGYAPVNGLEMYYEIHGEGQPLLLVHGILVTTDGFGELLSGFLDTPEPEAA